MARQAKKSTSYSLGVVVFACLIVISGLMLAATGNFDNPLRVLEQAVSGDPANQDYLIRDTVGFDRVASNPYVVVGRSQMGGLLFDVWFLIAVMVGVILTQQVMAVCLAGIRGMYRSVVVFTTVTRPQHLSFYTPLSHRDALQRQRGQSEL